MKHLFVDSTTGGRGDLWMRFVGFYAMAAIKPDIKMHLLIPEFIRPLAEIVFGDRIVFEKEKSSKMKLEYTAIGLRNLIPEILKGRRYISPFQRVISAEKKNKGIKEDVNLFLFEIFDKLGLIHMPAADVSKKYHGYLETAGIKMLKDVSFETFSAQVNKDFDLIYERLNGPVPLSPELKVPEDIDRHILFFANGNSRQFAPLWWAKANFPDAYYAFFYQEPDMKAFMEAGLKVIPFYKEPGDIVEIAKRAKWVVCTDSFASHVIQSANKRCTVLITEVIPSRVISPAFKGPVVDNEVACHPCLHSHRSIPCEAGLFECLNWKNARYTDNIKKSVPQ